jgi:hypothetical protein
MFMKTGMCCPHLSSLLLRGLLVLALGGPCLFTFESLAAQAAAPEGAAYTAFAGPASPPYAGGDPIHALILKMGGDLLALILFIGGVVFTVSVAKGALDAQVNTLVGSPMGVSRAQMNLIATVVTGLLTMFSPLIVIAIFNALAGAITSADITVPAPTVILH